MIQNRFYNLNGVRWEARFFRKGDPFPDTVTSASRQGVWMRPVCAGWDRWIFAAESWKHVELEPDVIHIPAPRLRAVRRT